MYSFRNDYSEGAHPQIIQAIVDSNLQQQNGYGEDSFSEKAAEFIKNHINKDIPKENQLNPDIHLLTGGTQTNLTALSAFLRPHEAVVSASTGHILVHEAGAIEATGHKILSIPSEDGKITVENIKAMLETHTDEHMVKPKLVFISNSTEIGSIYKKAEIESISNFCRSNHLFLYIDGARLGSALNSTENDLTLFDLSRLTDAYYIGGTKNGALIGEALIINNDQIKEDFRFHMKQKGALLAKGRLVGIQFEELFRGNLYNELAEHANRMAALLKNAFLENNYKFLSVSSTNQIFPILPNSLIAELEKKYEFYVWSKYDNDNSAIRLVTSWATSPEVVLKFNRDLKRLTI